MSVETDTDTVEKIDQKFIPTYFQSLFHRSAKATSRVAGTCCENRREIACIDAQRSLENGKSFLCFLFFFFIAGITAILFEAL